MSMNVNVRSVATERVIHAVSSRRVLWDPRCTLYRSRAARHTAWAELCAELLDGYHQLDDNQKRATENKMQQRWRNARDCYVKMKTAQQSGHKGKAYEYVHSDIMSFLERTLHLHVRTPHPRPHTRAQSRTQPRTHQRQHTQHTHTDSAGHSMTEFEQQLLQCLRRDDRHVSPLQQDDYDFFKSLGPMLKGLDHAQKLIFRSKVIGIALEMGNASFGGELPSSSGHAHDAYPTETVTAFLEDESSSEQKYNPLE